MNKKLIILITTPLILAIIIISVVFYLRSLYTVTFEFKKSDIHLVIYRQAGDKKTDTEIGSLDQTGELRLQAGKYSYVPEGEKYDLTINEFEIKDTDTVVTVDPDYSSNYREALLDSELSTIHESIRNSYPNIINNYTIDRGKLFKEGQWYGTILTQKTQSASEEGDVYRTVLKKENGKWAVAATPALIVSAKEYPDIPAAILSEINKRSQGWT